MKWKYRDLAPLTLIWWSGAFQTRVSQKTAIVEEVRLIWSQSAINKQVFPV